MRSYTRILQFFALSAVLLCTLSCVSDIDFEKTDEIVLAPRVDADLVFFTIDNTDFDTGELIDLQITVRDTTQLEFLNDDVTQENLKEVELRYKVENTFGQSLVSRSLFLNAAGDVQYEVTFPVNASIAGNPEITEFMEVVSQEDLEDIRNAIQLVSEVVILTNGEALQGVLSLESKALYSLEFTDL